MMRALVLGSAGQLGTELSRVAWPAGWELVGADQPEIDITNASRVAEAVRRTSPAVVVNAAAYTAVDDAEGAPELAYAVNRDGAANVAAACAVLGAPLVHVSTDYVFDGSKAGPYVESDPVAPLGVYGASKLAGEEAVRRVAPAHVIVRTSWLYASHGHNFVRTILRLAREREELRVVNDQSGCPTSARDLAAAIVAIASRLCAPVPAAPPSALYGTYHYAGAGVTTWFDFACAIVALAGARARVVAIPTSEYPMRVRRPAQTALDCGLVARTFGVEPRPWRESLAVVIRELGDASPRGATA